MSIDKTTVFGLLLAFGLVFIGGFIACHHDLGLMWRLYINQPDALLIALGGSFFASSGAFTTAAVTGIPKYFPIAMRDNPDIKPTAALVNELVEYASEARRNGVLSLDAKTADIKDPFIKTGIQLAVDGTSPEQIEEILHLDIEHTSHRHKINVEYLKRWAEFGPAFGMIGTLLGLIAMLANLSDPDAIGPAMAVALCTTMYGCILANMVCIPIAVKLELKDKEEVVRREMVIAGILSIQNGDNPRVVKQKLLSFMDPATRNQIMATETPA